ncbi:MAG TPA: hypothetical protein VHA33_22955 [Candidatus Angelobacter sp.]|jgi:hypothetical protein|nr:hypothetical protein [Candidatus Angelobacter sp.]
MKKLQYGFLAFIVLLSVSAWADSLELKNGSLIKGTYVGGTETQVSFRVGSTVQQYDVADIVTIKFESSENSRSGSEPGFGARDNRDSRRNRDSQRDDSQRDRDEEISASPRRQPYSNSGSVTIPMGTRLTVRTIDAIDSDKNRVGDKFSATLEQPLYVNDVLVASKGADVYGRLDEAKEAGHIEGRSQLKLSLTGIVINGQTVPLTTGEYDLSGKSRGANTAKKVGVGAAAGAVVGAIVGGGKGAAVGAGVGAGAGTAVQVMTKGEQVHVPSETLLEFALDQPITVQTVQNR